MKKIIALMLTLCLIVGLAAGCGSDTTTSGEKTWVVATDTVFKPFEYTDKDNNFVGIDVDIMKAVAEDQGFKYELKSLGLGCRHRRLQGWPGGRHDRRRLHHRQAQE